ncbi:hypothetical protein PCLA_02r0020 [Pseudomonas citronellolis]|nr:hypothetical protein PCLA_02r0020 [Pseudomonas citronellolis]
MERYAPCFCCHSALLTVSRRLHATQPARSRPSAPRRYLHCQPKE